MCSGLLALVFVVLLHESALIILTLYRISNIIINIVILGAVSESELFIITSYYNAAIYF